MNGKLPRFFENLIPYLMLGIAIAIIIGLFIMFSYILLWGLLVGGVLWLISLVKSLFSPRRSRSKPAAKTKGRVIEHDQD